MLGTSCMIFEQINKQAVVSNQSDSVYRLFEYYIVQASRLSSSDPRIMVSSISVDGTFVYISQELYIKQLFC